MKKGPVGSRAPAGWKTRRREREIKKGRSSLDWNSRGTKGTFDEHEENATGVNAEKKKTSEDRSARGRKKGKKIQR